MAMRKTISKKLTSLIGLILISSFVLLSNCTSDDSNPTGHQIAGTITVDSPTDSGIINLQKSSEIIELEANHGTSAPLIIQDFDLFEYYRFYSPINNTEDIVDFRVYIKLQQHANRYYPGKITLNYYDYGDSKRHTTTYESDRALQNGEYNVWFQDSNQNNVFHGIFQEKDGALIVVIDHLSNIVSNPDSTEETPLYYGGSIWIMNFHNTYNNKNSCDRTNPFIRDTSSVPGLYERNKPCWKFFTGPFDCRSWRQGEGIDIFRAAEPDGHCYQKLATFEGLDILKAFTVTDFSDIIVHNP